MTTTRRTFLQRATAVTAITYMRSNVLCAAEAAGSDASRILNEGWEYLQFPLANPWEVWSAQSLAPWTAVTLPHCFNSYDGCDPDVPAYRGKGWYRRRLEIDNPFPQGRTLLHFEGAGQSSEIYIGDTLAARHAGGYDGFTVDITEFVEKASHGKSSAQLSVLCDNSPEMDRMPSDLSDFTLYGGLYRNVHLAYVPAISLERVHVHVSVGPGQPASIIVQAKLYAPNAAAEEVSVHIVVRDPNGVILHTMTARRTLWQGSIELATFDISNPQLWSPSEPRLHYCEVTLKSSTGTSQRQERFGIRYFEFQEKGPFFLNGRRLLIQGTHRHEDHAGYAAAMPTDLIRHEMQLIKDMGANFIRLAHYQQKDLVLQLCDELGLLVWEELPWCRAGIGSGEFQQHGRDKLTAMIDQHFNHASIVCWGLGNEDDWDGEYPAVDKDAIRIYMTELNALAHKLDNSRVTSFRRADFARDIPDVYAPSIWAGWYSGRYVDYEESLTRQRDRVAHMLHVEWGADSHARRHAENPYAALSKVADLSTDDSSLVYRRQGGTSRASTDGDWSETFACDLFDWHLKVQQSLPWLSGAVQWVFKDFTTPLRPENPVPRMNQKGVVQRDLTKKESYYVFQSYWAAMPMIHIYGHTWPTRWGAAGQPRRVRVYSNCPAAELFLNGKSLGKRKRDIQDFPCAGLRWDTPFRLGLNTLRAVATTSTGQLISDQIAFDYNTETWAAPAALRMAVLKRDITATTVEASVVDAEGRLCLDARSTVRFAIAGGKLLDNLGTSNGSRVIQVYNGKAELRVQPMHGQTTVSVSAADFATVSTLL